MYEELVKRLREESEIERWLQPHSANETPKLLDDAADAIEELNRAQEQWIEQERNAMLKSIPKWISVTERLPDKFQSIFAACKSEGRENWTIDTVYDPFLKCHWGRIPILESGKAVVYAWMDNSAPEPPKEEEKCI